MGTVDATSLNRLRTTLNAARTKPDPQRLDALTEVIEQLMNALEAYSSVIRVAEGAANSARSGAIAVDASGSVLLQGHNDVTLKAGTASIILKRNGDVTIRGKDISVKADKDVQIKGSKLAEQSATNAGPVIPGKPTGPKSPFPGGFGQRSANKIRGN